MYMKINPKEIFLAPNLISLFRLLLFIPFLILFRLASEDWSYRNYIFLAIIVAFISDLLDGFVARKTNKISEMGKIIDPLADKVLMAIVIINLLILNKIPEYFFYIVILRDIMIFGGGIFVSRKLNKVLPSNLLGKLTVFSIGLLILAILLNVGPSSSIYQFLLVLSMALSFASVIGYAIRAIEFIKKSKQSVDAAKN